VGPEPSCLHSQHAVHYRVFPASSQHPCRTGTTTPFLHTDLVLDVTASKLNLSERILYLFRDYLYLTVEKDNMSSAATVAGVQQDMPGAKAVLVEWLQGSDDADKLKLFQAIGKSTAQNTTLL
jgi:hypothetical protein